jgi:histidinol phosphatase-like PHP family hydrolase
MLLKGGLHIHTTCSDGKLTPQEAAEAYREKGFDFIAFTDHDFLLKPETNGIYEKVKSDMILLRGVELTVFVKGYLHVSRITGEKEILHILNHLGDYNLSREQMLDRIRTGAEMFPLDAVEITSKGFRCKEWEIPEIHYPKVAADDSHSREGIGRAWIELEARRDKDSILRAVKRGDFWNCYL